MDKEDKKELKEMLNQLEKIAKKVTNNSFEKVSQKVGEALAEECVISLRKEKDSKATRMEIAGGRLTILLYLAGLENSLLEKLECDDEEFAIMKNFVGHKEADNE